MLFVFATLYISSISRNNFEDEHYKEPNPFFPQTEKNNLWKISWVNVVRLDNQTLRKIHSNIQKIFFSFHGNVSHFYCATERPCNIAVLCSWTFISAKQFPAHLPFPQIASVRYYKNSSSVHCYPRPSSL